MEDKSTSITNSADSLGMMWGYRYRSSHKNVIIPRSLKDHEEKSDSETEEPDAPESTSPTFELLDGLVSLKPDEATINLLFFSEKLVVVDIETEAVIGQTTISIEKLGNEILVRGKTTLQNEGQSSFISCVSKEQFSLTQERRMIDEGVSLFYLREDKGSTLIMKNGSTKTERAMPSNTSENLVGYGNAAAIGRFMAVTKFEGALFMDYLLDNGCTVSGSIESTRSEKGMTVIFRSGNELIGRTDLTPAGQLLRLHLKIRSYYFRVDDSKPEPLPFRVKEVFKAPKDDMQIRQGIRYLNTFGVTYGSLYEDRRMKNRAEGRAYVDSQPEIQILISNFVQNVLRFKPVNIIAFAVYHFAGFRNHKDPEEEDDPDEPPEDARFCLHVKQFHRPVKYEEEPSDEEDLSDEYEHLGPTTSSRIFIPGKTLLSRESSRRLMFSYIDDLMGGTEAIRYIPDDLELHKVLEEQLDKEDFISYFEESINNDYLLSESEIRETLKYVKDLDICILPSEMQEGIARECASDDMQSTRFYSGENDETVNINYDCSVKPYTKEDGTPAVFHNVRYEDWPQEHD